MTLATYHRLEARAAVHVYHPWLVASDQGWRHTAAVRRLNEVIR